MPNRLREVRAETNCRMMELTARSGVSASILCAIERYDYAPAEKTQRRIAAGLGVEIVAIWPAAEAHPGAKIDAESEGVIVR